MYISSLLFVSFLPQIYLTILNVFYALQANFIHTHFIYHSLFFLSLITNIQSVSVYLFFFFFALIHNTMMNIIHDKDIAGIYPEVKLPDYRICICSDLWDDCKLFIEWFCSSLHSYQQNVLVPIIMLFIFVFFLTKSLFSQWFCTGLYNR